MKMMIKFYIYIYIYIFGFVYFSENFKFVLTFCVVIKTVMVLINTLFTLCHCVTKKGSIFWFLDRESISKSVKYFCPRMAKGGFC
jgi:hypothetical protein